jgi:O-antigen/teichoic acid export membrane protein
MKRFYSPDASAGQKKAPRFDGVPFGAPTRGVLLLKVIIMHSGIYVNKLLAQIKNHPALPLKEDTPDERVYLAERLSRAFNSTYRKLLKVHRKTRGANSRPRIKPPVPFFAHFTERFRQPTISAKTSRRTRHSGRVTELVTRIYRHFMHDSLHKNATLISLSNIILAVSGGIFWLINARLFSAQNVGLATALISLVATVSNFSMVGFNNLFLRFIPKYSNRNQLLNTGFLVTTVASLILGIVVFLAVPLLSPNLQVLSLDTNGLLFFLLFSIATTFNALTNSVFIALRAPGVLLVVNIIFGCLRIILVLPFDKESPLPILIAYLMATTVAALLSLVYLVSKQDYLITSMPRWSALDSLKSFTVGSYAISVIGGLPAMLLPIIIASKIGAADSAYFYLASTIGGFLSIIPVAIGQSLTVEGAYNKDSFGVYIKNAAQTMLVIMIPLIFVVLALSHPIMMIFGHDYARNGTTLLRLLALSGMLTTVNYIAISILNVEKKVKAQISVNVIDAVIVLGGVILLAHSIVGVGMIWLAGEVVNVILFAWFARLAFIGRKNKNVLAAL